jgi:CheY-like chemotaxis protein
VLIIEDEPLIAMELQLLPEDVGATSFAFADHGEDAIAEAMIRRPALITSDVKLSNGTGPSAIRTIQSRLGNTSSPQAGRDMVR